MSGRGHQLQQNGRKRQDRVGEEIQGSDSSPGSSEGEGGSQGEEGREEP